MEMFVLVRDLSTFSKGQSIRCNGRSRETSRLVVIE